MKRTRNYGGFYHRGSRRDSLDVVDLVMSIEESFDVEIPDEEVENIKTVGDIVKYIENKVEE